MLDRGQLVAHPGQEGHEHVVHDDDLVLGVIDHVGQLVGEEPDVEGVEHGAHGRCGQVRLQVGLVVPQEGAHPVVAGDPEPAKGGGQLVGSIADFGESGLIVLARWSGDRQYLTLPVDGPSMAKDPTDE